MGWILYLNTVMLGIIFGLYILLEKLHELTKIKPIPLTLTEDTTLTLYLHINLGMNIAGALMQDGI